MRLALLFATAAACTSQTTEGTWTVTMQLDTAGCFDPEPANVTFLLDVHTPAIDTAGLVATAAAPQACGGPGQPDQSPTPDLSTAPFVPASSIRTATATDLGFDVDTSADPSDPMPTAYTMKLSGDQLTGDAIYHARPDCIDRWTLIASPGE